MNGARSAAVIAIGLAGFIGLGLALDSAGWLQPVRGALHEQSGSAVQLRSGRLGDQLAEANRRMTGGAPEEDTEAGKKKAKPTPLSWERFGKKRGIYDRLMQAGLVTQLQSTHGAKPEHHSPGIPTISIWVDEADLYDPQRGIIPNWTKDFERRAQVSYFEEGELKFAANCGIRLHGGTTRVGTIMDQRGLSWRSFRLMFRDKYGLEAVAPGVLLPKVAGPIRSLTVRGNHFIPMAVAFDIARKVGNLASEIQPARLILNGEPLQTYSLLDHLGNRQWKARLGHDQFLLDSVFRTTKVVSGPYFELRNVIRKMDTGNIRAEAEALVDFDDYMRHMFVVMYCAAADWGEGRCFLDLTEKDPKWRWVHWDLDNAFRVVNTPRIPEGEIEPWQKGFLDMALKPFVKAKRQARVTLFQNLVEHDPQFRYDFSKLVQNLLNHEVKIDFVVDRVQHYKPALNWKRDERYQQKLLAREHPIQAYAKKRPIRIREDLSTQFEMEPATQVKVRCAGDATIEVDGYSESLPYEGWYFAKFPIELEVPPSLEQRFSHWLVDGARVNDRRLIGAGAESDIELVLEP